MTQQLPHGSQASLGETCAFYLDYITASLPSSLHSLHHKFVSPLISHPALNKNPLLRALTSVQVPGWASLSRNDYTSFHLSIAVTLAACAIALVVMSWRNLWRRPSPAYHTTNSSERPYTYITPDDIVDPPPRSATTYTYPRREEDDSEPDKLLLNHRKVKYELHFPPFSISDGTLSIGQLRQAVAEVTNTADLNRIRLLYKGKPLNEDNLPCRSEGLKQQSEIFCVVSEVRTPSDASEAERTSSEAPRPRVSANDIPEIVPKSESTRKRNRKKNKKGKKKKSSAAGAADDSDSDDNDSTATPPPQPPRPAPSSTSTAPTSSSTLPPAAPNLNSFPPGLAQVHGLAAYFRKELLPLAERYIANPPADQKTREFEHKKLGEFLLAQVILKADGIEPSTDEIRTARRALIKEAQGTLNRVDAVAK